MRPLATTLRVARREMRNPFKALADALHRRLRQSIERNEQMIARQQGVTDELLWIVERFTPLGYQRVRIFTCLGGDMKGGHTYFVPPSDLDIYDAFRMFVTRTWERWRNTTDPLSISLLAAGRLLIGDVAAADLIIDHLPAEPPPVSVGQCLRAPHHTLASVLPLPQHLTDTQRWAQGTPEQAELRARLAEHRDRLRWLEQDGVYRLMS